VPSNRISVFRQVARQDENRRWEHDNAPGGASRRAQREERRNHRRHGRPSISALRRAELIRLFEARFGQVLPNDDSGEEDAQLFADHCGVDGEHIWQAFCRSYAPWLTAGEISKIFKQRRMVEWTADDLGCQLGLRDEERTALKICTIGAIDCGNRARKKRRKIKNREREAARRTAAGATPHSRSLSRLKPWVSEGISRTEWYDRKKENRRREAA
jgi:hypothetical protein